MSAGLSTDSDTPNKSQNEVVMIFQHAEAHRLPIMYCSLESARESKKIVEL